MNTRKSNRIRRFAKPLLMLAVGLTCFSIVAATLRRRPDINQQRIATGTITDPEFESVYRAVNEQLATAAAEAGLSLAPSADNLQIARRLSIALVGSGLSLEEVRALQLQANDKQISWWTDYLLQDRRWADYFAERFARAFVGVDEGPFILFRRRKFRLWLADQFEQGVPYDEIVRQMLSSDGLWTDTPQVNFVTATIQEDRRADPIRLAGRTSRVLLGQRIDCLQCHDDFLGELNFGSTLEPIDGTQQHFHALAAFFSGAALPEAVFQGIREDEQPYSFKFLGEEQEQLVTPEVPFQPDLLPAQGKPRERLATWVTHSNNRAFSRALVNRVWALMFSRPLVEPVDSIPLDLSVIEGGGGAVLELLAEDFAKNGFDLRRLIRLIAHTDAFRRSSRADFDVTPQHEAYWAVFPLTQLRPEQVAGSVFQANMLTAIDESSSIFTQLKSYGELQDFLKRFGDRGEDEFNADAVTIQQRLIMMNGKMVKERTGIDLVNNSSSRIAALVSDNQQAIQLMYLATLNRSPSQQEMDTYTEFLQDKKDQQRSRAMGDIFWSLINSTEFSWNH